MKICPKCGKELDDDQEVCNSCGFAFDTVKKDTIDKSEKTEEVKNVTKVNYSWIIASICSFIMSCIMIYKGYDKYSRYYYSEDYGTLNVNAYVGGDAYNYIINSNYATGFYVLATLFAILGIGFLIIHYLAKKENK